MSSAAVVSGFKSVQRGFQLLAALQLTAYLAPPQAPVNDGSSFDFIVVGGGTAGSVVASRLSEHAAASVLLLEAGGDLPLEATVPATMLYLKGSKYDWNLTSEYDKHTATCHREGALDISQGKMLGGTSALNYNLYGRGNARDYQQWAALAGDALWGWDHVLPYFIKSERMTDAAVLGSPAAAYHGTAGNIGVSVDGRPEDVDDYLQMLRAAGEHVAVDLNEDHPTGFAKMMFTIADGKRQTTATSYLTPAKNRTNLSVLKGALVTKILIDEHKRATGVQARTQDGKTITLKANKEVIVSAGAFNTPKLLMLSGIGPAPHLSEHKIPVVADLPVGQNLQDHVGVNIITQFREPEAAARGAPDPRRNPATAVVGYSALDKSQKYPDYETMSFFVDAGDDIATHFCTVILGFRDDLCDAIHKAGIGKRAAFIQLLNLAPESRGEVKLRSSDPADPVVIHTNYFGDEKDLDNLVKYVSDFSRTFNGSFYASRGVADATPQLPACAGRSGAAFWRCYVSCMSSGMSYFAGTSALGAVLDARLRVRGVAALRVADASAMPRLPSGNIYAPVIMLAEKAADLLRQDHQLH